MRLYVGVDVARDRFDLAVLDPDRRIHAMPHPFSSVTSVVDWLSDCAPDSHIAIDAPQRTREGLLAVEECRRSLVPPPPPGRYLRSRECDYHLMRRGLPLYTVPAEYADCPDWMRAGFELFGSLLRAGNWTLFDGTPQPRCLLEVYPFAAFAVMMEAFPPRKSTAAGREARLQALRRALAADAPVDAAVHHHSLDALAAAYTAWTLDQGLATWVGDPREGLMVLPAALGESYAWRACIEG
jgi:predicted nuclease with RNAse H fold